MPKPPKAWLRPEPRSDHGRAPVNLEGKGVADFHELRRQLGQTNARIVYRVFDLLWLDGADLRPLPWSERKARLQALLADLPKASTAIDYVEPLYDDGPVVLRNACRLGLEGIVSKRVDASYRGGRSDAWRKDEVRAQRHVRRHRLQR